MTEPSARHGKSSVRLLLCIDHFGPGGAQRQIVNLAAGLKARGHDVEFFVYHPDIRHFAPQVEELGIPVHGRGKRRKLSLGPVRDIAALLRTGRYDGALAFLRTPAVYTELAGLFAGRVPIVASERFMYTRLSPLLRVRQELHRLADWVTVNSHHQRERMESDFPWMRRKISTIYNGVDLERFSPGTARQASEGPVRALVVASTARKKNAAGLVQALAVLKARGEALPLVSWVGAPTGPDDEAAKAEAAALLRSEGLEDKWEWLGRRSDVPELLRAHDVLVHPAFYEGLPNAICEAFASGLPVLAGDVCDHPRLLAEGRGLLFDPTDPNDIADAIARFSNTSERDREEMSGKALAYARSELSLDRYAREYEGLFLGLLEHRGLRPATPAAG